MVIDWMYGAAAESGWWMGPYSTGGDSHEGILRNTGALKNGISMLGEARAAPASRVRPRVRANPPANRLARSTRTCGRTGRAALLQRAHGPRSGRVNAASVAYQTAEQHGPDGPARPYPWPLTPSVGENPNDQPDVDALQASRTSIRPRAATSSADRVHGPACRPQLATSARSRSASPTTASRSSRGRRRVRAAAAAAIAG